MSIKLSSRTVIVATVVCTALLSFFVLRNTGGKRTPAQIPVIPEGTMPDRDRIPSSVRSYPIESMSDIIRFHPKPGYRYTYQFDRQIKITGMSREIPEIRYGGKLHMDIVKVDSKGFDALVSQVLHEHDQAGEVVFKLHINSVEKKVDLQVPTLHGEMDRQHADILKDLVANWMFTLESDTVGAYQADFSAMGIEDGYPRYEKTKIAYIRVAGPAKPDIVRSRHVLEWDSKQGVPHRVEGDEITRLGSGKMNFKSKSRYQIAFESISAVKTHVLSQNYHSESLALTAESREEKARARFTAEDWPKLLNRLATVASLSSPEQLELFGDLSAFLAAHGEFLPDFLASFLPA